MKPYGARHVPILIDGTYLDFTNKKRGKETLFDGVGLVPEILCTGLVANTEPVEAPRPWSSISDMSN